MSRVQDIISELQKIAAHPGKAVEEYVKKGGRAVGIAYVYAPEEIIHASGCLPVGMWGAHKSISKARAHLPPFACSIAQSVMELEHSGVYDILEAVVWTVPCDTLKCMSQMWKGKCPSFTVAHPQNRKIEAAAVYLEKEYDILRKKLEPLLGPISDAAVENSIKVYNDNRCALREFSEMAALYPETLDPVVRHAVIKARFFMEKSQHTALVRELVADLKKQAPKPWKGKKVILSGIMAEPDGFLNIFREFGFAVVDDDLAQEDRQYRLDVPDAPGKSPLYRLAGWWRNLDGCSLAADPSKKRVNLLIDKAKRRKADAVILCMMKFCDPEEFDYPVIYPELDKAGIPNLVLEVDLEGASFEQIRTRVQTFSEILA